MDEGWKDEGATDAEGAETGSPRPMGGEGVEAGDAGDTSGREDAEGATGGSPRPMGGEGAV